MNFIARKKPESFAETQGLWGHSNNKVGMPKQTTRLFGGESLQPPPFLLGLLRVAVFAVSRIHNGCTPTGLREQKRRLC